MFCANITLSHQTPRSKYMLYPFFVLLWGTLAGDLYMMGRLVLVSAVSVLLAVLCCGSGLAVFCVVVRFC